MTEKIIEIVLPIVMFGLKIIVLKFPDKLTAKIFRFVEWLIFVVTGDKGASMPIAEMAEIFESGPPFTTTARKMFENLETEIAISAVRCLTRPSPYGAA
jgi:hypothetical protein